MPRPSQRDALLDAAEVLLARDGVAGLSVRAVNTAAGRNPSSAHHYFGSKEGLIDAVLRRRMEPVMRRRHELLVPLFARHMPTSTTPAVGGAPTTVEILTAFTLPLAELLSADGAGALAYVRVIARMFADRSPELFRITLREFTDDMMTVDAMLAAANQHVPAAVLWARRLTAYQTIFAGLAALGTADPIFGTGSVVPDGATVTATAADLVRFCAAGISADCDG